MDVKMAKSKSLRPNNLHIIVRPVDYTYQDPLKKNKIWYDTDPIITHFFNALQATFPEGEKFFIQAALDGASQIIQKKKLDRQLKRDMDLFIRQEARHSHQHSLWTKALVDIGYKDMEKYDHNIKRFRTRFKKYVPATFRLAITAAAEHYTASLAFFFTHIQREFLINSIQPFRGLLLYHAMEELEHKSVCFDLYQNLSGNYFGRMLGFLFITIDLMYGIFIRFRYLMRRDGKWDNHHRMKFLKYLIGKEGIIKGLVFKLKSFLKPSFHPWQTDERQFINKKLQKLLNDLNIIPFDI